MQGRVTRGSVMLVVIAILKFSTAAIKDLVGFLFLAVLYRWFGMRHARESV